MTDLIKADAPGMEFVLYLGSRLGHVAVCLASGNIPDLKVTFCREGCQVDPFLLKGQGTSVGSGLQGPENLVAPLKTFYN